mgnify:CR=1 FL=1
MMSRFPIIADARDFAVAILCVLAVTGGLRLLAVGISSRPESPVRPDDKGQVVLTAHKATIRGKVTLFPTDLEDQLEDYTYSHGRKVLKERQTRRLKHWKDPDVLLTWTCDVREAGSYDIVLYYSCADRSAGGIVKVTAGNHMVRKSLRSTEGWETWKKLTLGAVELPVGRHQLSLGTDEIKGEEFLRFEKLILRK